MATLSSVDREYLQAKLSVRAPHLVRTGVDTEYFKPCPGCVEIPNSLIFVGYFKHPPNVEALHYFFGKIWPCILQSVPGARMTVVGRFAPPEVLAYSQKDVVTFTDFVPDLRPHLQRHSVFVAPIVSGAGLRGKILEALAMGKAVVATSLCVEGYPFVHGCELMIAHDAEEFARNTVTLLNDPACRARLGRQGRAIVEKQFGSRHFTEAYENLHAELFQ